MLLQLQCLGTERAPDQEDVGLDAGGVLENAGQGVLQGGYLAPALGLEHRGLGQELGGQGVLHLLHQGAVLLTELVHLRRVSNLGRCQHGVLRLHLFLRLEVTAHQPPLVRRRLPRALGLHLLQLGHVLEAREMRVLCRFRQRPALVPPVSLVGLPRVPLVLRNPQQLRHAVQPLAAHLLHARAHLSALLLAGLQPQSTLLVPGHALLVPRLSLVDACVAQAL